MCILSRCRLNQYTLHMYVGVVQSNCKPQNRCYLTNYGVLTCMCVQDQPPLQPDWITGLSSQGFLQVGDILQDPRTTQEPTHHQENLDLKESLENLQESPAVLEPLELRAKAVASQFGENQPTEPFKYSKYRPLEVMNSLDGEEPQFLSKLKLDTDKGNTALVKTVIERLKPSSSKEKQNLKVGYLEGFQRDKNERPRIKSDIFLAASEKNSSDFKHVMEYNQHFVPHLTKELYHPGFKVPNPGLCSSGGRDTVLVIMVVSAPSHVEERAAIRAGWGRHQSRAEVVFGFLVGPTPGGELGELLAEQEQHGDLVINNVEDVYENLSLKTISGLEWFDRYCAEADYLLKVDDDMYVQVDRLLSYLSTLDRDDRKECKSIETCLNYFSIVIILILLKFLNRCCDAHLNLPGLSKLYIIAHFLLIPG